MKNREIKFRIWNGIEMIYDITVGKFGKFYVNPSNNGLDEKDSASITPLTTKYPDDIPLMQYTGLRDKGGKEIYEGDYLHNIKSAKTGVVRWKQEACQFWVVYDNLKYQELTATYGDEKLFADYFEVIGHEHEH